MKNIGIITFHCVENYGAFLQTYASVERPHNFQHNEM